ncbi:MAG: tRNA pseudouridine(38-40) synthase TruA [Clostridiales bacterium]|jgi:tRNA pseudouridine38-40 synthase|nr:tRNA pseudouridine(38-40) synthase TruA [Clostridiales bacterium]
MKQRFLITIEYDGRGYSGWQRQKNGVAIQAKIEEALLGIFGEKINLYGSSRTDAGVSAYEQTAHFDVDTLISAEKIPHALNSVLPNDIAVTGCIVVADDFHARFAEKKKTYVYRIYISPTRRPIFDRERLRLLKPLDIAAMKAAAEGMVGRYDCSLFQKSGSPSGAPIKTVYSVEVTEPKPDCIDITVTGDGFLYKMVRTMAGTLVYVGQGKLTPQEIADAVKNCDKEKIGKTLAGEFLYLLKTEYATLKVEN